MLELQNGLLTFMEMLTKDKVDLIKVTLVSITSFQYLQSLVHLLGFSFLIIIFKILFYGLSWTQISCYYLSFFNVSYLISFYSLGLIYYSLIPFN